MARKFILILFVLVSHNSLSGQHRDYIPIDCTGYLHHTLEEVLRTETERKWRYVQDPNYNYQLLPYQRRMEVVRNPKYFRALDSLFSLAKKMLVDKMGAENYCRHVSFSNYGFKCQLDQVEKTLSGNFNFSFSYKPLNTWFAEEHNKQSLDFKFYQEKDGTYRLEEPDDFKDFNPGDCEFKLLTKTDMALQLSEKLPELDIDNYERTWHLTQQALHHIDPLTLKHHFLFFDNKTGLYDRDTLIQTQHPLNRSTSLANIVAEADFIVDATCIVMGSNNNHIGLSRVYKVHHCLKGSPKDSILVHNTSVPKIDGDPTIRNKHRQQPRLQYKDLHVGQRGLLFLKESPSDQANNPDLFKNNQAVQFIRDNLSSCEYDFYNTVFPKILQLSDSELQVISTPDHITQYIKEWLTSKGNGALANEEGSYLYAIPRLYSEKNTVTYRITLSQTKDLGYLINKNIKVKYDTSTFAPYAVKNKAVSIEKLSDHNKFDELSSYELSRLQLRLDHEKLHNLSAYKVNIKDISANELLIEITAKSTENLIPLMPQSTYCHPVQKALIQLNFKLNPDLRYPEDQGFINISIQEDTLLSNGSFLNRQGKTKTYAYQHVTNKRPPYFDPTIWSNLRQKITNVTPEIASIGDTITITGVNLLEVDKIGFPATGKFRSYILERNCPIPEDHIISKSYYHVSFIVPAKLRYSRPGLTFKDSEVIIEMTPRTGQFSCKFQDFQQPIIQIE